MKEVNIISVSGGKDSTALLLLALEQGVENIRPIFADTGNEHQETYDYIDYLEQSLNIEIVKVKADFTKQIARKRNYIVVNWRSEKVPQRIIDRALEVLKPTGNPFLDLCLWKGRFPSTMAAFCSAELKRNPIMQQVQELFSK